MNDNRSKDNTMTDALRILGLTFTALHGVRHEEKTLSQPFEVDIEIHRDLSAAAKSDHLDDTVNYPDIVEVAKRVIHGEHTKLIEHLAGRILDGVADIVKTGTIVVRVRKPRAPIDVPFRTVEVELRREVNR